MRDDFLLNFFLLSESSNERQIPLRLLECHSGIALLEFFFLVGEQAVNVFFDSQNRSLDRQVRDRGQNQSGDEIAGGGMDHDSIAEVRWSSLRRNLLDDAADVDQVEAETHPRQRLPDGPREDPINDRAGSVVTSEDDPSNAEREKISVERQVHRVLEQRRVVLQHLLERMVEEDDGEGGGDRDEPQERIEDLKV